MVNALKKKKSYEQNTNMGRPDLICNSIDQTHFKPAKYDRFISDPIMTRPYNKILHM